MVKRVNFFNNNPLISNESIISRANYYLPGVNINVCNSRIDMALSKMLLTTGSDDFFINILKKARYNIFNVDYLNNPFESYEWINCANTIFKKGFTNIAANRKFIDVIKNKTKKKLDKTYVFGTGPSLLGALDREWSDGYRVVCNTIVRDKKMWEHIHPDFVVAGDWVHHFGHSQYAQHFRKDLLLRLEENDDIFFLYPEYEDIYVQRLCKPKVYEQCIPVPISNDRNIHYGMLRKFSFTNMSNVLLAFELPLGCTLSRDIFLWGFDGKKKGDKYFWNHAQGNNYPELYSNLIEEHPAFFNYHLSEVGQNWYQNDVMGKILENALSDAEKKGFSFCMMHDSHIIPLNKRKIAN